MPSEKVRDIVLEHLIKRQHLHYWNIGYHDGSWAAENPLHSDAFSMPAPGLRDRSGPSVGYSCWSTNEKTAWRLGFRDGLFGHLPRCPECGQRVPWPTPEQFERWVGRLEEWVGAVEDKREATVEK